MLTMKEVQEQGPAGQLYRLMRGMFQQGLRPDWQGLQPLVELQPLHYVQGLNRTMENYDELVGEFERIYRDVMANKPGIKPNIDATLQAQAAKLFAGCGAGVNIQVG